MRLPILRLFLYVDVTMGRSLALACRISACSNASEVFTLLERIRSNTFYNKILSTLIHRETIRLASESCHLGRHQCRVL